MKQSIRLGAVAVVALLVSMSGAFVVRAESVQWNQALSGNYTSAVISEVIHLTMTLSNPAVTVNYYGSAFLVDSTGAKIQQLSSGSTLNAGDRVLFEFGSHQNSDISWYGTGAALGTPYGYWRSGATDPGGSNIVAVPAPVSGAPTCEANPADKYATQAVIEDEHYVPGCKVNGPSCATTPIGGYGDLYAAYSIAPPSKSVSTSGAWSGCVDAGNGNKICTVGDSGGGATASLVFASTQSRFYGDMVYNFTSKNFRANDGGKHSGCVDMGTLGSAITVPQREIQFNFSVNSPEPEPNESPLAPTLTAGGSCVVGEPHSISMVATDPDGDRIRYGVDWNNNGTIDQWVPPSGYVNSGSTQIASRTFSVAGSKTIRVRTQDTNSLLSNWATITFTCAESETADLSDDNDSLGDSAPSVPPPAADLDIRAIPSLVRQGHTTQVNWSATNVQSCTVSGSNSDQWSGVQSPIGGRTSSAITGQTVYTLACIDLEGAPQQKEVIINVIATWQET